MKRALAILALILTLPAAAHAFTVSGRFLYEDRIWDGNGYTGTVQNLPIRRAQVEIVNVATTLVLASGVTDGSGNYSVEVTGQTLPVSFYARCLTDGRPNYQTWVVDAANRDLMGGWVPPNAPVHAITTGNVLLHNPASPYSFGDHLIQDTDGTGVAQAFNIFDCTVDYFDYLSQPGILGRLPDADEYVTYSWGPANANEGSNYTQNTILLSSPGQGNDTDAWSDTVILHEAGHWYDDNFSRSDNPGGAHFIGDNDASVLLAYGEGSATFQCAKVREWRAQTHGTDNLVSLYGDLMIPPPVGTPGGLSFSYDFETGNFADTGRPIGQIGSANETNITSALWDLLDGPGSLDATPGSDDDNVEVNDSYAWDIEHGYMVAMSPGNALTVEDYWQGWFALNGSGFLRAGLENIFVTLAKMPFIADGLEPDGTLPTAGSITPVAHAVSAAGKVVISELHLGALDAIELYNSDDEAVDLTGWRLEVFANGLPAQDSINTYVFPAFTLNPGEVVVLHEAGTPIVDDGPVHLYAGNQQNFNAAWNSGLDGACLLRDDANTPVDFVKWRDANGENNHTAVPAGLTYTGQLDTPPAPNTLARDIDGTDTDAAADFSGHYGSLGSANHPSPQYHTLFDVGDQDVIGFLAVAGTRYGFETKGPYSKSDPRIELLDANGAVIASNDNYQSNIRDARLDFLAGSSCTRYVRVTHVGAQTDYAEYQLLAFVRPASSVLLPPGGLSATAANASDDDDAVHLQWVNASAYDSVRVYRGGTLVTTLAGSSDQFDDAADRGLYRYEVSGVLEGTESSRASDDEFAGVLACATTDDFESGNANLWIREDSAPGSHWDVVPGFAADGTFSFSDSPIGVPYRGAVTSGNVNAIAVLAVPTRLQSDCHLIFDHICITEDNYDYGIVEISNDDGLSWTELARYDQGDDPGWADNVADPTDWRPVNLDLTAYNGMQVLIRFRLQSDTNLEFEGWYVDNLQVTGCGTTAATLEPGGSTAVTFAARPAPNPVVAGNTVFQYVIGGDAAAAGPVPVSFTVHDMMGRQIRTLASELQGVGRYRLQWNAADDDGRRVPPGVYYAKLRAGKLTQTVKVAVIR